MPGGDSFFVTANYAEAALWGLIAVLCAAYALRRSGVARRRSWQAAAAFLVFGLSDVVEVHTGAWWRPRWLLVWKAACVVVLLALAVDAYRRRDRG